MKRLLIVLALVPLLAGCARTYHVRAYDLKGEEIYDGRLKDNPWVWGLETPDGKKVMITNATVIMEEVD